MSSPDKIALDVGANAGDYAVHMARYSKSVEAFEPVPGLAAYIRTKFADRKINVRACALSDKTGKVTLRIPVLKEGENPANATVEVDDIMAGSSETRDVEVPCYRLDDLKLDRVGLIKLDAEGHETPILRGAADLIERDRPNVLMEADDLRHRNGCVDSARAFFDERRYTGFFMLGRKLFKISEFDPLKHQNPSSLDANRHVIFGCDYVDSFVFVHDPKMVKRLSLMAETSASL
jgi:FkbM family methyltransferase